MGISAYKEVTEWNNPEFRVPSHTYLFDGKSNILAYARESDGEVMVFKKPLPMDTRRRKFIKVKHKELNKIGATVVLDEPKALNVPHWQVKSDSGKTYTVTLESGKYQCNCVGFSYRNKCKHSDEVRKAQEK
ncbi:hypothetical protein EBU71_01060 [bacterium]|nr:hypothetical protein [Candidatus Elulimicrobium humile]